MSGYNRLDLSKLKFKPDSRTMEEALADVEPMFDAEKLFEDEPKEGLCFTDSKKLDETIRLHENTENRQMKHAEHLRKVLKKKHSHAVIAEMERDLRHAANNRQLVSWLRELKTRRDRDDA